MKEVKGNLNAKGIKLALVVSRFNEFITKQLLEGAVDAYERLGGDPGDLTVVWVPGALEIPLVARRYAERDDVDAVVALGCVIRGATYHFDVVAGQSASGLMKAGLDTGKPIVNGILTTDTIEQAIERAGTKAGNKGADAVMAAVEISSLLIG
ncbi:6,7-dimethyl-8-ribityllumazine synthase [Oceanithermus sp.]